MKRQVAGHRQLAISSPLPQSQIIYPVAPVPYPLFTRSMQMRWSIPRRSTIGLYALRSSETIVSPAAAAYEIAKPLHESVRIALDEYVHPQDFASRGVRCRADNSFSPFT